MFIFGFLLGVVVGAGGLYLFATWKARRSA